MKTPYPKLFEPVQIGKLRLKNRIAMAPMGFPALSDPQGLPTQRYVDYFTERAKGGAGLLMTGMLKVEDTIEHTISRRGPIRKDFIRPFADLTEQVHALGTKLFAQVSPGLGYQGRPHNIRGTPVAPSAIPNLADPRIICRALTTEEVEQIVQAYGNAAEILASAGVDGIEVHGHGGFLLDQFTTSLMNQRTDKYGGDLEGRLTFSVEILNEIKKRVGKDYPVQYRFGLKHYIKSLRQSGLPDEDFVEMGRDIDEGLAMAKLLQSAGYDSLAVDAGTSVGHYWAHPPIYQKHGCMLEFSAMVKQVVDVPVIAVGRLDIPELAESAIAEGKADIVSLAKGLLADPYWPNKVREGRVDDIRPCIGCHQACSEMLSGRQVNSCTVNPACGRERTYELQAAQTPRKIFIAGGGVAGMEAARVSATRGHQVTLVEKTGALGGHLIEAGMPTDKKDVERLNTWYQRQLQQLGVDVRLHTAATPELVEQEGAEVVVVATGSVDVVPRIPGIDLPHVSTTTDLFLGKRSAGANVVVVGAGENGCEVALWLSRQGKQVQIVEMQAKPIAIPVAHANRNMLLDLLQAQGVPMLLNTAVREIGEGHVTVADAEGQTRQLACDSVVLAVGMKADNQLYRTLATQFPGQVYDIGDCQEPKNIMKAVWDAFEVGRTV